MRGQSSIEYLLIVSAVLTIFATVTYAQMINPATETSLDTLHLSQARSAADAIAGAMNTVYSNGIGATSTIVFSMDSGWSLYLENARENQNVRVSILASGRTENVRSTLKYAFSGYLSNLPHGTYTVIVEWPGDKENIVRENYKIYIRIRPPMRR